MVFAAKEEFKNLKGYIIDSIINITQKHKERLNQADGMEVLRMLEGSQPTKSLKYNFWKKKTGEPNKVSSSKTNQSVGRSKNWQIGIRNKLCNQLNFW